MKLLAMQWINSIRNDKRLTWDIKILFLILTPVAVGYAIIFGEDSI